MPIKQLELRAIFGVDREITSDEMLQRCHSLLGVHQLALVDESDIAPGVRETSIIVARELSR